MQNSERLDRHRRLSRSEKQLFATSSASTVSLSLLRLELMARSTSVIETGLDDLSKLELTGLLTTQESKQVLKRRSKYEHALARRHGRNERVYLAYIDYETNIERLLKVRAKVRGVHVRGNYEYFET